MPLADIRTQYGRAALLETDVDPSPFVQFERWLNEALEAQIPEATAMTLATVNAEGQPSARIVLLKGLDERGFVFFTNFRSRKGRELQARQRAALLFFWPAVERQVRIEGTVERLADTASDAYYESRPLASRIGAWVSEQSTEIANRQVLEQREAELRARLGDNPARPPHWGGLRVVPTAFEFWQGRPSRLHDRIAYLPAQNGWRIARLAP